MNETFPETITEPNEPTSVELSIVAMRGLSAAVDSVESAQAELQRAEENRDELVRHSEDVLYPADGSHFLMYDIDTEKREPIPVMKYRWDDASHTATEVQTGVADSFRADKIIIDITTLRPTLVSPDNSECAPLHSTSLLSVVSESVVN